MLIYDVPPPTTEKEGATASSVIAVDKDVFLRPDLRMFDSYDKAFVEVMEKYEDDRDRRQSMQNGHRNMLKNAVLSFYMAGHKAQAVHIYNELRKLYPLAEFEVSLEAYVKSRFREEMDSIGIDDAKEQIVTLLRESYYLYAIRSDDEAAGREELAKEVHRYYTSMYSDENRIDLPEMDRLRYVSLIDFLNDRRCPPYLRAGLLSRMRIERPNLYAQFGRIERQLKQEAEQTEKRAQ
jgi:hypothetical protein